MFANMGKEELIYPDESYYLLGLCYSIQNTLGSNQNERQYADALELLFKRDKKEYRREYEIQIPFAEGLVGGNRVDFIFESKILVDLKAKQYITKEDYRQMIRYLEASGLELGIVINFRGGKVTFKRVVKSKDPQ